MPAPARACSRSRGPAGSARPCPCRSCLLLCRSRPSPARCYAPRSRRLGRWPTMPRSCAGSTSAGTRRPRTSCGRRSSAPGSRTSRRSAPAATSCSRPARRAPEPEAIERELERELGYAAPVFLRSADQLAEVAAFAPFSAEQHAASDGKLQVTFLLDAPAKATRVAVLDMATADDPLALRGSELYWLPKGSMRDSGLELKALAKLLGLWTCGRWAPSSRSPASWRASPGSISRADRRAAPHPTVAGPTLSTRAGDSAAPGRR